jgi:hypothetical protein
VRLVGSNKSPQVKLAVLRALLNDAEMLVENLTRDDLKAMQDVGLASEHRDWLLRTPENLHGVLSSRVRATEDVSGTLTEEEIRANVPTKLQDAHNPTLYYVIGAHLQNKARNDHTHHKGIAIRDKTLPQTRFADDNSVLYGLPLWDTKPETLNDAQNVMATRHKDQCAYKGPQSWVSMEVEKKLCKNSKGTISSDFEELIRQGIRGGVQPHSVVRPSVLQRLHEEANKGPEENKKKSKRTQKGTIISTHTHKYTSLI